MSTYESALWQMVTMADCAPFGKRPALLGGRKAEGEAEGYTALGARIGNPVLRPSSEGC